MLETIDRLVLAASRRVRRRARERQLKALPGYVPEASRGRGVSGLRGRSVTVLVAAVTVVSVLPGVGFAVASEMQQRAAQERYEVADANLAEAQAAYSAARAVELEVSEERSPENVLKALRSYGEPESETARELQAELQSAGAEWSAAVEETK